MITKLRLFIFGLAAFLSLAVFAPSLTFATCEDGKLTPKEALQCGTKGANGGNSQSPAEATKTFNQTVHSILNILTVIAGVVAVIMIIVGGFRFITSGGNPEKVKSARSALMYAVIGIVIVALAQIIVQFVLDKAVNTGTAATSSTGITTCDPITNPNCHCTSQGCVDTSKP